MLIKYSLDYLPYLFIQSEVVLIASMLFLYIKHKPIFNLKIPMCEATRVNRLNPLEHPLK